MFSTSIARCSRLGNITAALVLCAGTLLGVGALAGAVASASDTTDADAMYQRYRQFGELAGAASIAPNWMADGGSFWYATGPADDTIIYKVDVATGGRSELFDVARLRKAIRAALGKEPAGTGVPFRQFTLAEGERMARFMLDGQQMELRLESYDLRVATPEEEAERRRREPQVLRASFPFTANPAMEKRSPDGKWLLTSRDHDVWLRSTADGRERRLTSDGMPGYSWGPELTYAIASVDQPWSPDSKRLVVSRTDMRAAHKIPVVHWLEHMEEVEWLANIGYGDPWPRTELWIVDVASGQMKRVEIERQLDAGDHYVMPIGWRAKKPEFLYMYMTRNWKRVELRAADPATGASRTILVEEQPTFLGGIDRESVTGRLTVLDDDRRFLWRSERDGWDHLYLYDLESGKELRRLTSGSFPVMSVKGVDLGKGWVYLMARAEPRIYDTHLYRVPLERAGGLQRLTAGVGTHQVELAPSREYFVDTYSTPQVPPVVELRRTDGKLVRVLAQVSSADIDKLGWTPPEEFTVKAADGSTDLHGLLYKPHDFDPRKKYPVIELIYGGPQVAVVPHGFVSQARMAEMCALAQYGYIVFVVDGRGTPGRGKAFQDVVYGNFGRHEIPDHVAALRHAAATRPYMDLDRVGITGHSLGGYFTARAMFLAPDLYKVGVALSPGGSRIHGPAGTTEPYMDLATRFPEAIAYSSNEKIAGRLQGKLLLVIGTSDVNTPFSNTMRLLDALARANKPYDLIVLPEANHLFDLPDGADTAREYARESTKRFLLEHLPPGPRR